ncbi:MAG: response regulator [Lachnospiraceae bacterium]|nr:response regulator [Lachnospiraceae bacterium]
MAKASGTKNEVKSVILIVDDDDVVGKTAKKILGSDYKVELCRDGKTALDMAKNSIPDLILLDVYMPDVSGFDVIKSLKKNAITSDIPVVFMTADEDEDTEIKGFAAGASDFIRKPFVAEVLRQRVKRIIRLEHLQKNLEAEVSAQTERIEKISKEVMIALSGTVDAKDHYTNGHSGRVAKYSAEIARRMGKSHQEQNEIFQMGLLHDIGKIGVSENIINKKGRLSDDEYAQIKNHPSIGYEILKNITALPGLAIGARWHHERFDGRGYPDGLSGTDIPEEARIIGIADAYDAMTSYRAYSGVRPQMEVRAEIERCMGSQFDPDIAKYMLDMIDEDKNYDMCEKLRVVNDEDYHSILGDSSVPESVVTAAGVSTGTVSPVVAEKSEAWPAWLESLPGVDVNEGVKSCGSISGYMDTLKIFYDSIDKRADEIEQFYNDRDWNNYIIKVHALKSSTHIIGIIEMSNLARELENAAKKKNIPVVKIGTNALLKEYRELKDMLSPIAAYKKGTAKKGEKKLDKKRLEEAYSSILELAVNYDFDSVEAILNSLSEYKLTKKEETVVKKIRTCMDDLDWNGVQAAIKGRK